MPPAPAPTAPEPWFYIDDICTLRFDNKQLGVVERTPSDIEANIPRPQDDYDTKIERHPDVPISEFAAFLKHGRPPVRTVLILWYTAHRVQLIPTRSVTLVDRPSINIGDTVKKQPQDAMSGTVVGARVLCDLQTSAERTPLSAANFLWRYPEHGAALLGRLQRIPAEELETAEKYQVDDMVLFRNTWVGRVQKVYDEVTMRLMNNSIVTVEYPEQLEFLRMNVDRVEVGDMVKTTKANVRRGVWREGAYDANVEPIGDVVQVRTMELDIDWSCRRIGGPIDPNPPPMPPSHRRLPFPKGELVVYDRSRRVRDSSKQLTHHQSLTFLADQQVRFKDFLAARMKYNGTQGVTQGDGSTHVNHIHHINMMPTLDYDLNVFSVCKTSTTLTVQWQDASVSTYLSTAVIPDVNFDYQDDFWPGDIVCLKPSAQEQMNGGIDTWKPSKVGVIQSVKASDRLAEVLWQPAAKVEYLIDTEAKRFFLKGGSLTGFPVQKGLLETVTTYDIMPTPDLVRKRGDFVTIHTSHYESASLSNPDLSHKFRTTPSNDWFGEVVDIGLDGLLVVRTGAHDEDGVENDVQELRLPPEFTGVAYSRDEAAMLDVGDGTDSETVSGDSMDWAYDSESPPPLQVWVENDQGERGPYEPNEDEDWDTDSEGDGSRSPVPEMDGPSLDPTGAENGLTSPTIDKTSSLEDAGNVRAMDLDNFQPKFSRAPEKSANKSQYTPNGMPPKFDVLEDSPPESHHFIKPVTVEHSIQRLKRIQKEHKILTGSLPDGVFVRTWESRLDLLRVLLVGPADTPYEFAPFLLDIRLPNNYPMSPPEVFFHSWTDGSGPINPNLYEDGKICLSLLGT